MSQTKYPVHPGYSRFLKDESGLEGFAESIVFPENLDEIRSAVAETAENRETLTVQGGLTGLCGSAVPCGGTVLNLSHYTKQPVLSADGTSVTAAAGTTLQDLNYFIQRNTGGRYFFPVEPTEKSATVGGIISQNASGLTQLKYGALSNYIRELILVDKSAEAVTVENPAEIGRMIGSEGMAGIIAEAELTLSPVPPEIWSMALFFDSLISAADFSREMVQKDPHHRISAMELFDRGMIRLMQENRENLHEMKHIPEIGSDYEAMLLVEIAAENEKELEDFAFMLVELSKQFGCDPDRAWVVSGMSEAEKMRSLKHAATEAIRMFYCSQFGGAVFRRADLVLHGANLSADLSEFRRQADSAELRFGLCGQIGLNRVSATLFSGQPEDFKRFFAIRKEYWKKNPPVSPKDISEHGIGKLNCDRLLPEKGGILRISDGFLNPCNMTNIFFDKPR
jgi:D-lactate dehydrogenase (cytochrome)